MERVVKLLYEPFWPFAADGPYQGETVCALYGKVVSIPRLGCTYISITDMRSVENRHPEPHINFRVYKSDIDNMNPAPEGRLIGFIHRHPPGLPSPSSHDYEGMPTGLYGAVWCEGIVSWYDHQGMLKSDSLG